MPYLPFLVSGSFLIAIIINIVFELREVNKKFSCKSFFLEFAYEAPEKIIRLLLLIFTFIDVSEECVMTSIPAFHETPVVDEEYK